MRIASSQFVVGECDLDRAVVEQFGMVVAGDFVHFVEAYHVKKTIEGL
ncbi:hypothetical protein [Mesorhizobium sp. M1023]